MKDLPLPFNVPIPAYLENNDRDRRGLPIPFIVYRDIEGNAHFSINNVAAVDIVLAEKLCGLCGQPLKPGQFWLIGGPASSFLEDGMYIDPPTHEECARYSAQVCAFLAAPNYAKRVEAKTLKAELLHDTVQLHDNKIAPPRPLFFAMTCASGIDLIDPQDGSGQTWILPHRPWMSVEFWRGGKPITQAEAEAIAHTGEIAFSELIWWPRRACPENHG